MSQTNQGAAVGTQRTTLSVAAQWADLGPELCLNEPDSTQLQDDPPVVIDYGDPSANAPAMPNKRNDDGNAKEHTSSGTQQEHLSIERLKPAGIHNTQATVNQTF